MSKRVWLGIASYLMLTCHLAAAQPAQLPPITVQGEHLDDAQFARETSTFATVVNTQDATARVDSVSELLTENVGVQVRRFGGLGAFSTVSIRGSTPNQVDVYLDNVRLNQARAGLVDLGDLPLDNIERIEIYRGFAPLQLGAGSIGGAVHLVTHRVAGQTLNRASISYGSFNTRKLTLYRSQGFERFGYLTLFNYTESDGDFKFLDDNGTRFTTDDDETVTRRNNDFRSFNINAKGEASLWGWDLRLSNDFFTKDQGVPGRSSIQSDTARLDVYRNVATLHAKRRGFPHEMIDLDLQLSYTWQREDFQDPKGDIGTGIQDQENTTQTWSGQSLFNLYLDAWHQIVGLMLEWRYETFRTIDKLPELRGEPALRGPLQRRTNLIVALQDEIVLFDERLAIRPLFRYQFVASRFGAQPRFRTLPVNLDRSLHDHLLSPSLGVKFSLMSYLDLKGNIGRFQRLPTLFELFGDRGTTIGNDKLKPETSVNWDVGFVIELPRYGIVDRVFFGIRLFWQRCRRSHSLRAEFASLGEGPEYQCGQDSRA